MARIHLQIHNILIYFLNAPLRLFDHSLYLHTNAFYKNVHQEYVYNFTFWNKSHSLQKHLTYTCFLMHMEYWGGCVSELNTQDAGKVHQVYACDQYTHTHI